MKVPFSKINADLIVAFIIILIYIFGFFFPEKMWGIHFTSFLSDGLAFVFLLLPLLLIIRSQFSFQKSISVSLQIWKICMILLPIAAMLAFYHFPIPNDFYGNARNFYFVKNTVITQLPQDILLSFFKFEFIPGQGRNGVKLLVDVISFYSQQSLQQSFILLNTFFGGLYVMVLIQLISSFVREVKNRIILSLVFITSPMFLVYFGHIETYAPVFFLLLVWLSLYVKAIRSNIKGLLIPLFMIGLIGLRFHTLFILLVPAFLILSISFYAPSLSKRIGTLKKTFLYIYLPLLVVGLVAYFFIFKDYNDPRKLTDFTDIERLFLPMVSPEAPLDKYNLFSFNHFLDFANVILLWSPALLFLLITVFSFRKKINWNSLEVSSLILTIAIFCTFLFAINPLLSMPMDWDLFMFPVTLLFVFSLALLQKIELNYFNPKRTVLLLATTLLCIPSFLTILSAKPNSYRVESVGKHIYKTYYEHGSTYILYAIGQSESQELYETRLEEMIAELQPFSMLGNDKQYADLLIDYSFVVARKDLMLGRNIFLSSMDYSVPDQKFDAHINGINQQLIERGYAFSAVDQSRAMDYFNSAQVQEKENSILALQNYRAAFFYYPISSKINYALLEAYFKLEDFQSAYQQAIYLSKIEDVPARKKLRILIHTSLEADEFDATAMHCKEYLTLLKEDQLIQEIYSRLLSNDQVEELKYLFRRRK